MEIHPDDWWIRKFELYGFRYDDELTQQARAWAEEDTNSSLLAPNGQALYPQHLLLSLKVFVNPAVGALPRHQHLFPDDGCFLEYSFGEAFLSRRRPCGSPGPEGTEHHLETPLPPHMLPLPLTADMHRRWNDTIAARLQGEVPRSPQSA